MPRTVSVSGVPKWLLQCLVAGFAVFLALLLGSRILDPLLAVLDVSDVIPGGPAGLALSVVLWLSLTALWVRTTRSLEGSGSTWGPIPEEQYSGRFAEVGGIARHNWERAVERLPGRNDDAD